MVSTDAITTLDDMTTAKLTPFADALVKRRLAIPISQDMLAATVGCTLAAVCNHERAYRTPTLYFASRIAKALGMPEKLRTFHTLSDAKQTRVVRDDLRTKNPGVRGHYPRKRIKIRKADDADNYRVSADFADMALDAADRLGYDLDTLEEDAEIPQGRGRMIFATRYKNLPLVHAANIAHVLGMTVKLADFAADDIQPIKPLDK